MADEHERKAPGSGEKGRRFRLVRKVKSQGHPTELRELADMGDDADRGTPEQDASLREGCMSMVRVVGLFFVVMFASIIATWCIKR